MKKNLHSTEDVRLEEREGEKVLTTEDIATDTKDMERNINKLRDTIATDPTLSPEEKETFLHRIAKLAKRTREIVADVAFFPAQFLPERKTTAEYDGLNLKETLRLLEYKTAGYENPKELFFAMRKIKALFPENYPDVYIKNIAQIFSQNKNMVQIFENLKDAGWAFYDAENILEKHASAPELLSFSVDPVLQKFKHNQEEVAGLLPLMQKYGISLSCLVDFYEKNPTYKQPEEGDRYLFYSRPETTPDILKQFYTSIPREVIQKYYSPEIEKYKKEFATYIGSEDFSLPPDILPLLSEETMPKIRTLLSTEKKISEYQKTNQLRILSQIAEFPTREKILDILFEENVPLEIISKQRLETVHTYLSNPDFQKSINEIRSKVTEKIPILPGNQSLSTYTFFEMFQKSPEALHALPAFIDTIEKIQGSPWTPYSIASFLRNDGFSFLVNPEKINMLQTDMARLGITNTGHILSLDTRTRHNIFESNFTETLAKHTGDFRSDSSFFRMEHFEEKITLLSSLGINPEMIYEYGLDNTYSTIGTQKITELQNMITTLQTIYKISPTQTKDDTAVLFRFLSNNSYDSRDRKIFSEENIERFKKLQSDIPFSVEAFDLALLDEEIVALTFSEEIKPLAERLRQKNSGLSLREIYNIQKTFTESGKKSDKVEKLIDLGVDFKKYHDAGYVLQRIQNSYHDEASYCISSGISIRTSEEYDGLQILFTQGAEKMLKKYASDPTMRTFLLNTYATNLKYADTRPESWHEAFLEKIIETRTQALEKNIPEAGIQSILELVTSHHLFSAEDTILPFDTELALEIIDFVNRHEKNSNLIQEILKQRKQRQYFNLKKILGAITKVTDSENPYIQKNKEALIASIVGDVHIQDYETFVKIFEEHEVEIEAAERLFDFVIFKDDNIEKTLADIIAFKPTSALSLLEQIPKGKTLATLKKNMGQLATIPKEKLPDYFTVFVLLEESPSQEMQRIKGELTDQILSTENPTESYKKIEAIFIKNNIPLVGKIFNIFQVLHPQDQLQRKINNQTSPILQEKARAKRGFDIRSKESIYALLYSDLLNIHVRSGNRALAEYANVLASGEILLSAYEERELIEEETDELSHFLLKMETLLSKSQLATRENSTRIADNSRMRDRIQNLRESFSVAKGESFGDRISAMFLRPTGLSSLSLIPKEIERFRNNASVRNETLYEDATEKDGKKYLSLSEGDLLKGVPSQFLENILQNGSVAKEFLGASSDSDATPFDTDLERISKEASEKETQILLTHSVTTGYGDIRLYIKDRGQFQKTVRYQRTTPPPEEGKYELFQTGAVSAEHYGIRTGFPSTEIDALILSEKITQAGTEKIFFEIAKNGFYIPVADETGKIIFTPEQYKTYRAIFSGIERYGGAPIALDENTRPEINTAIQNQLERIPQNRERTEQMNTVIRSELGKTLRALGVHLKSPFDTSILGAELHNTGSTGRGTNLPNDFDFDLILRLDTKDFPRVSEIYHAIKSVAQYKTDNSHESAEYIQLRLSEVSTLGNQTFDPPIDIDIGFNKKSDLVQFGSHNAIEERLDAIQKTAGKDARDAVVANITLTKEILKKAHAYKKFEDGGIGGIGVENWILAHGGSIETAFQSFLDVAVQNGRTLPYEEFVKQYSLIDPGINLKFNNHDNFIKILKPEGYEKMIRCIQDTLHS